MKKLLTILYTLTCLYQTSLKAQTGNSVNGLSDERNTIYAFTNANIFVQYNQFLSNATLLIQKDKVLSYGTQTQIPAGATIIDVKGMYIYPAFIDIFCNYGMPENSGKAKTESSKNIATGSYYKNTAIRSHIKASELFSYQEKDASALRKIGFGYMVSHIADGIARGTGTLVHTGNSSIDEYVITKETGSFYSFDKGSSKEPYPGSLMGSIALLRQAFYDAQWYASNGKKERYNETLEAMNYQNSMPSVFECKDILNIFRAHGIGQEMNKNFIYKGSGDEYKRIEQLKKINPRIILPVNFPDPYEVSDAYDALNINVSDMKHWELAPANASILFNNKIPFCFTTFGLKNQKDFFKNIRKSIQLGLPEEEALKALTFNPAMFLNLQNTCGSLEQNRTASFIVCTKKLFDEKNQIISTWINGQEYINKEMQPLYANGSYFINLTPQINFKMEISGLLVDQKITLYQDSTLLKTSHSLEGNMLSIFCDIKSEKNKGIYRIKGLYDSNTKTFSGNAFLPSGDMIMWQSSEQSSLQDSNQVISKDSSDIPSYGKIWYPNMAFGFEEMPKQEHVLIKNATIWTNESEGILQNSSILISNGKIIRVGEITNTELNKFNGVKVIDAKGKHVTPGIIDEHSHIAISNGVNEGTQAITAEVSIGTVINSDDINIYRQLSGGVTTSHLLHGSANPIGGQTALIKLRWGKAPEEMKFENSDGFIKFALGENVKQANWGDEFRNRYPQTRMGVEQLLMDAFNQAKLYEQEWSNYLRNKNSLTKPRKDLEKEVLLEILNKKRFITCHSYQQAEINMLMHVADSFNFTVNTFTHILEGYKVADKMKKHGAGASSFSDWWAYKYEVIEAIPYNGSILNRMGIVTAFNSDDAEMARRLNQEAAKAVKYGNTSEEDALKFVTLNPAKLLHIDHRVGSLKAGKDADIVIWNDHPLSVYATVYQTYVDGICYYDHERDKILREKLKKEKIRLTTKMLHEKKQGSSTQKASSEPNYMYNCNELDYCAH